MSLPQPVTFRIDEASHYALWLLMSRRQWRRGLVWSLPVVITIGAISAWTEQSILDGLVPVVFGIIVALIIIGIMRLTLRSKARKVYAESASLHEEMTLTIADDGFQIDQASGLFRSKWAQVVQWDEDDNIFAVFLNRQMAIIFPKHQMGKDVLAMMVEELKQSGLAQSGKLRT